MSTPLSEIVRTAADGADLSDVYRLASYWLEVDSPDAPVLIGSAAVHAHIGNGRPDSLYEENLPLAIVDADRFLSSTEQETVFGAASAANMSGLEEVENGTMLVIGHPNIAQEEPSEELSEETGSAAFGGDVRWVVGVVAYSEPDDRLTRSDALEMTPTEFGREFISRGGEFFVLRAPEDIFGQCAVATADTQGTGIDGL